MIIRVSVTEGSCQYENLGAVQCQHGGMRRCKSPSSKRLVNARHYKGSELEPSEPLDAKDIVPFRAPFGVPSHLPRSSETNHIFILFTCSRTSFVSVIMSVKILSTTRSLHSSHETYSIVNRASMSVNTQLKGQVCSCWTGCPFCIISIIETSVTNIGSSSSGLASLPGTS